MADGGVFKQDAALGLRINGQTLEQAVKTDKTWGLLTNNGIKPVSKSLVVDMVASHNYPHDKMEGLWLRMADSKGQLGIANDDDFGVGPASGTAPNLMLTPKHLDLQGRVVDTGGLYIIDNLDLTPAN